jgi:hypothetical protein
MALSTRFDAAFPYRRPEDDFFRPVDLRPELLRVVDFRRLEDRLLLALLREFFLRAVFFIGMFDSMVS